MLCSGAGMLQCIQIITQWRVVFNSNTHWDKVKIWDKLVSQTKCLLSIFMHPLSTKKCSHQTARVCLYTFCCLHLSYDVTQAWSAHCLMAVIILCVRLYYSFPTYTIYTRPVMAYSIEGSVHQT